jgi:hypothetical protein
MYNGRRLFRLGPGMLLLFVGLTALFAIGAWMTSRERGWGWVSITLACATLVLGFGSVLESLILRIELADDAMIVTELTGRRRYSKADIDGIKEAKGVAPTLLLKGGRWVKLPVVGSDLGNSVRAWLKQT